MTFIHILGIKITTSTSKVILSEIGDYLFQKTAETPITIFTPNPEQVVYANENPWFRDLLNSSDINLPDGVGVVWAINQENAPQPPLDKRGRGGVAVERISGIDFMLDLIQLAVEKKYSVAFIGGRKGAAEKALRNLQKRYPGLEGWAENGPEIEIKNQRSKIKIKNQKSNVAKNQQWNNRNNLPASRQVEQFDVIFDAKYIDRIIKKLQETSVRLVFVGLGAPKQEMFIKELQSQMSLRSRFNREKQSRPNNLKHNGIATSSPSAPPRNDNKGLVLMSVGGAFDVLSGKLPRAPVVLRKLNLEWLWRLYLEPFRLFRQIRLIKFVWLVIGEWISGKMKHIL